ncbi:MAG: tRNA (adenosine(37)-N6)-dimethylallyltransferase MiaA [Muribaculaceae bacterium]|nr:tRNA (adenosine(37)-N6)-dimethylallyltransferase MiaA [Muribaculaceae bacterium]
MRKYDKTLVVVTGPTGSGKTDIAVEMAQSLGCEIVSADSRQMYRELPIGTAAPTARQLAAVPHYLVGNLELEDYYSAARFEEDVLALLPKLWMRSDYAIMCGGSMMYIDAVCNGIDRLPTVSDANREAALRVYHDGGLEALIERLKAVDSVYLAKAPDLKNHKRLVHALEVSLEAGLPYSSLLTGQRVEREFNIVKFAVSRPREELFDRINSRVDAMMAAGMEEEARQVYHKRHLNSLNTVGYKELFAMFDGIMDRETAIARIGKNTRVYAKKQMTWLKRDGEVRYITGAAEALDYLMHT